MVMVEVDHVFQGQTVNQPTTLMMWGKETPSLLQVSKPIRVLIHGNSRKALQLECKGLPEKESRIEKIMKKVNKYCSLNTGRLCFSPLHYLSVTSLFSQKIFSQNYWFMFEPPPQCNIIIWVMYKYKYRICLTCCEQKLVRMKINALYLAIMTFKVV